MLCEIHTICWLLGVVQILGLASGWLARISAGSRCQTCCHRLFLACLALAGGAAVVSAGLGPICWLVSSITLSAMVLTVTCDFSGSRQGATW